MLLIHNYSYIILSKNLQFHVILLRVVPMSLVEISITVYMPSPVMLKLQFVLDRVRLEHSFSNTGVGPSTSRVRESVGGVYTDDDCILG